MIEEKDIKVLERLCKSLADQIASLRQQAKRLSGKTVSNDGIETIHLDSEAKKSLFSKSQPSEPSRRITLNARGQKFEILLKDLERLPEDCRLVRLKNCVDASDYSEILSICDDHDLSKDEFYFNKSPFVLELILEYTSSNKFHINCKNMCPYRIYEDLSYWNINPSIIEMCCSLELQKAREETDSSVNYHKDILDQINFKENFGNHFYPEIRAKIWDIVENGRTLVGKIYTVILVIFILLSTCEIIMRSLPEFKKQLNIFDGIEFLGVTWFTIDWLLRFIFSPRKLKFMRNFMNICDLLSIVPFYVYLGLGSPNVGLTLKVKNTTRMFRVFSIFKLFKFSSSVKTLTNTIKLSYKEIGIYFVYVIVAMIGFSTIVFYAENDVPDSHFYSIPTTFW